MKTLPSIFFITFTLLSLYHCSSPENRISENTLFQAQLPDVQSIPFGDSNYFDTCYLVRPETTSNSLIAEITQLEIFDHKIYIWDRQTEKISVFDFQGKYRTAIGQKGRAPEEYSSLSGFCINPYDSIVYVFDPFMMAVKEYSLEGKFIRSNKHTNKDLCFTTKATMLDSNRIICHYSSNWEGNHLLSIINTSDYKHQEKIIAYPYRSSQRRSYTLASQPYTISNHTVRYVKPYSNVIYTYANQAAHPYFTIENKKEISPELLRKRLQETDGDYHQTTRKLFMENTYNPGLLNIFENERFLLTDFMTAPSMPQAILWDKKKHSGVHIQHYSTYRPDLQLFKTSYENTVVCIWNRDAIEAFKKEARPNKASSYPKIIKATLENFNEDEDNPILIFFRFKHQ